MAVIDNPLSDTELAVEDKARGRRLHKVETNGLVKDEPPANQFPVPLASSFGSATFMDDPNLAQLATHIIDKHGDVLAHLKDEDVRFYWKKKGGYRGGKGNLGACQKPSGLVRDLTEATFIIWLAADHCQGWTREQIEPLLFSRLCAANFDEKGNPYIAAPDFWGFVAEIRKYGPWMADLKLAAKTFRQLTLDEAIEKAE